MGAPALKHLSVTGNPTFELSVIQLGSDDLSESLRRDRAGVAHDRYGVTIASRTWKQARVWNLNLNAVSKDYIESLRDYFEAGSFYLYPDIDNTAVKYNVYWQEEQFNPVYVAPNKYALRATFKETTIGAGAPAFLTSAGNQTVAGNLDVGGNLTVVGTINGTVLQSGGTNLSSMFSYSGHNHVGQALNPTILSATSYVTSPVVNIGKQNAGEATICFVTGTTGLTTAATIGYYTATSSVLVLAPVQFLYPITSSTLNVNGVLECSSTIRGGPLMGTQFYVNQQSATTAAVQFSGSVNNTAVPRLTWSATTDRFNFNRPVVATAISAATYSGIDGTMISGGQTFTPVNLGAAGKSSYRVGDHFYVDNSLAVDPSSTYTTIQLQTTGNTKWAIDVNPTGTPDLRFYAGSAHGGSTRFTYGDFYVGGNAYFAAQLSAATFANVAHTKGLTLANTKATERVPMFYTTRAIVFDSTAALVAGTSPTVTWQLKYGPDASGTGTIINSAVTTSTTTGHTSSTMISGSVAANNWVWLTTTATGGTVTMMHLTARYREV